MGGVRLTGELHVRHWVDTSLVDSGPDRAADNFLVEVLVQLRSVVGKVHLVL